jgi:hypothetical protein
VYENSYNQTLAYRIDGPDVTYLGDEDLHDTQYDYLEEFADINAHVPKPSRTQSPILHGGTVEQEFGSTFTYIPLHSDTERNFSSNKPWVYTVVVASTFLFTSIVCRVCVLCGTAARLL